MITEQLPQFTLSEIEMFLRENDYDYEIFGSVDESKHYTISNFYNMISDGLYFNIGKSSIDKRIKSSIVFSDCSLDNLASNVLIKVDVPQEIHYRLTGSKIQKKYSGIHPTAIIEDGCHIDKEVSIGPYTVIEKNVTIEKGVKIGGGTKIYSNTIIKSNTSIDYNCNIGTSGMSWVWGRDGSRIIQPQLGGVVIGENCIISTDISIVRGTLSENTKIGNGTVIAHGTKIGHGCQIGNNVHFANNVSLAGNAKIGDNSFLGSGSVISVGIEVPSSTIVGAGAVVTKNFNHSFLTLAGVPAKIIKERNYLNKPSGAPQPFKKDNL